MDMVSRFSIQLKVYTETYGRKEDASIANTHFLRPSIVNIPLFNNKKSDYDREIPQSYTADHLRHREEEPQF